MKTKITLAFLALILFFGGWDSRPVGAQVSLTLPAGPYAMLLNGYISVPAPDGASLIGPIPTASTGRFSIPAPPADDGTGILRGTFVDLEATLNVGGLRNVQLTLPTDIEGTFVVDPATGVGDASAQVIVTPGRELFPLPLTLPTEAVFKFRIVIDATGAKIIGTELVNLSDQPLVAFVSSGELNPQVAAQPAFATSR